MDLALIIEKLLRESKSTSPLSVSDKPGPYWAHQRGYESEVLVIQFYQKKNFRLLAQRLKTPFAEVDLLFLHPEGHCLLVEVKTVNLSDFYNFRITYKQKNRLLRALQFLTAKLGVLVEVHWAFVTKRGEVTIIEDVSG